MASGLPPPPLRNNVGDFAWLDWYNKLYKYVNTAGTFLWGNINFSGSNITDIQTRQHNSLQSFQGGTSGEYFHLTQSEHDGLTNGGSTALHTHAHNSLSSLQGGTSGEYYHLTNTQYTQVQNLPNVSGYSGGLTLQSKAGAPTSSDIPSGRAALYKNTSTGLVALWVNDGGTLKSVSLL
jgi:hypothetical protein